NSANGDKPLQSWTADKYGQWFSELESRPAPVTREGQFQRRYAGQTERRIEGSGERFWADGVEGDTIVETKLVKDPLSSPFIPGSTIPQVIRTKILAEVENEFRRMAEIIKDGSNPLRRVEVITNDAGAAAYFEGLLAKFKILGRVDVRPEN